MLSYEQFCATRTVDDVPAEIDGGDLYRAAIRYAASEGDYYILLRRDALFDLVVAESQWTERASLTELEPLLYQYYREEQPAADLAAWCRSRSYPLPNTMTDEASRCPAESPVGEACRNALTAAAEFIAAMPDVDPADIWDIAGEQCNVLFHG